MSTIDQFKSSIGGRGGFARTNRFSVLITPPYSTIKDINEMRDLALMCESCSLPGRQIQTMDHSYYGNSIKVAENFINEDVSFTFHLTSDYFIKSVFDKWTNLIINRESFKLNYASVYKRDIAIYQHDINNKVVYAVKLIDAFPISVQSIELNGSENETQKVTVDFTYSNFTELAVPQSNELDPRTTGTNDPFTFFQTA
jgi:hypothetical protein